MEIKNISIDKLIPYEWNNKIHDETQIDRIANSIKEFGFTQPLVVDKDNIVIIGHGRLLGAKKLGLKEVPCVVKDDLSEIQIKKLRIIDNRLNESEWNLANLKMELDSLEDLNLGDLNMSVSDLFPEFDAPEFNPDEYDDNDFKEKPTKYSLTVIVKDEAELELLKKDLDGLGYTNYK